jgi:hypothetical protein
MARCLDRVKVGAALGGSIGMLAGLLFGGYALLRYVGAGALAAAVAGLGGVGVACTYVCMYVYMFVCVCVRVHPLTPWCRGAGRGEGAGGNLVLLGKTMFQVRHVRSPSHSVPA